MPRMSRIVFAALSLLSLAQGQGIDVRYETGRRLRELERLWDAAGLTEHVALVEPAFQRAVMAFFSGRMIDAARAIDTARAGLETVVHPGLEFAAWERALALRVVPRIATAEHDSVQVHGTMLYEGEFDGHGRIRLALERLDGGRLAEFTWGRPDAEWMIPVADLPDGEYRVVLARLEGASRECGPVARFTRLRSATSRLEALDAWLQDERAPGTPWKYATWKLRRDRLRAAITLAPCEIDPPVLDWLSGAPTPDEFRDGTPRPWAPVPGDQLIAIPLDDGRSVPARIHMPVLERAGELRPLLLALHGAGGSENLFFDGYGRGELVRRASERRFVVVAPLVSAFASGLDEVVARVTTKLPIDPEQRLVCGHSMGVARTSQLLRKHPDWFRGAALIAGAPSMGRELQDLNAVHFFLGLGERDPLGRGAVRAAARLREALDHVQCVQYPGVEHYGVVQYAMDDVFRFFDVTLRAVDQRK